MPTPTHASAPLILATHLAWHDGDIRALVTSLSSRIQVSITDRQAAGSAGPEISLHGFWTPEKDSAPDGPVARLITDILAEKIDVAEDSTDGDKDAVRIARANSRRPIRVSIDLPAPLDSGLGVRGGVLAGVAVGVDKHVGKPLGTSTLVEILREYSAEAEVAMLGGTRVVDIRGGALVSQVPVLSRRAAHWAICLVGDPLDATDVEEKLRQILAEREIPRVDDLGDMQLATAAGDLDRIAALAGNDLTPAVISLLPRLRRTMKFGMDAGALTGIVCGAGTAVAFLCRDRDQALDIAASVATTGAATWTLAEQESVSGASVDEAAHG